MNKLSILSFALFTTLLARAQNVTEIINKVRAKQIALVDVQIRYRDYYKSFNVRDTNYSNYTATLFNRKGNTFTGKITSETRYFIPERGYLKDTFMQIVKGIDVISCKVNHPIFYDRYKSNVTLDPLFYYGLNIVDLHKFILESEDSGEVRLFCRDTAKDEFGNRLPNLRRIKVRTSDYMIVEYEMALQMFNRDGPSTDYIRQELINCTPIEGETKKKNLDAIKTEFKSIPKNIPTRQKYAIRKAEIDAVNAFKEGDQFPILTAFFPGTNDSINVLESQAPILILDYFYTTCGPCIESMPHLMELFYKYKNKGLGVYGIDPLPNDTFKIRAFRKYFKVTYPLLKSSKAIPIKYNMHYYPTIFVLDKSRKIVAIFEGYDTKTSEQLEKIIIKLLAQ